MANSVPAPDGGLNVLVFPGAETDAGVRLMVEGGIHAYGSGPRMYARRGPSYGVGHRAYGGRPDGDAPRSRTYGARTELYGGRTHFFGVKTHFYGVRIHPYGVRTDSYEVELTFTGRERIPPG